jgi:uncharacterized protein (DUF2236 family)
MAEADRASIAAGDACPQLQSSFPWRFTPETQTWRINKELALLLGGGRALLMQIAHPMVAQGVADHSDFQKRPLNRLVRTLTTIIRIVFAEMPQAEQAASQLRGMHRRITGELTESVGAFPAHRRYFADNPALMLWVFATLVDTSLTTYERLLTPLSMAEKEAFYRESCVWGKQLGLDDSTLPADYPAFQHYLSEMIGGSQIAIGFAGHRVCGALMRPERPFFLHWFIPPFNFLSIGLLPVTLREKFGFKWTEKQSKRHDHVMATLRFIFQHTPERLRSLPVAWRIRKEWQKEYHAMPRLRGLG